MKPFKLEIITPEKIFFDGETEHLIARTSEGDVGILYGHTPYVANLVSGPVKVKMPDGNFRRAAVSGGVIKASPEGTVILASAVEWSDEIDIERAKRSVEDAKRRLRENKSQRELDLAEQKLKRALNRISVAGSK
ncbi:MAG: ATP synthase F1 subunit epsilon [Oscillospiraceae bacterium]|nr:ATP synthase F1 subunit epsilon [Oscillospiraceae bacterium]MBQ8377731.1 ATP synthase F1 subunit epsilon [Oscillospiraceae bacterium]